MVDTVSPSGDYPFVSESVSLSPWCSGSALSQMVTTYRPGMVPNQMPTGYPWWSRTELARGLTEHDNIEGLAEAWGCSEKTIRRWADRHGLDVEVR